VRTKLAKLSAALMLSLTIPACTTMGSAGSSSHWGSVSRAIPVVTQSGSTSNAPFCEIYRPVYWSAEDTKETVVEVKNNNVAYKTLCQDRKRKERAFSEP
jgi:hypothetical protein